MILATLIAARFLHFAALVTAMGASLSLSGSASARVPAAQTLESWALRALTICAALILLTTLLLLGATAANLVGEAQGAWDQATLTTILAETEFGRVWSIRMVTAILLAGVVAHAWLARRRALSNIALSVLVIGLTASLALTGHAAADGGPGGWVHRLADGAHLIAAGVWLGALPPLLLSLRLTASGEPVAAALAVNRLVGFHAVGLGAVLTLALTGLANSWFLVGFSSSSLATPYGMLLLGKVAIFAAMVALAANNRLRFVPTLAAALGDPGRTRLAARRLRVAISLEWLLGLLLLAIVAILGVLEPARAAGGGV